MSSEFFKLNFAEVVFHKEDALSQLGSTKKALTKQKADLEKKNLDVMHASTNKHQPIMEISEYIDLILFLPSFVLMKMN